MTSRDEYGHVSLDPSSVVGEYCVLGCPKESRLRTLSSDPGSASKGAPVHIGADCLLFHHVTVYEGVSIGAGCVLEDRVRLGYDTQVGPGTRLMYGAYVCDRVRIGRDTRIAGFVCDEAVIGDRASVMGDLVHEYTRPHEDWWRVDEAPPVIEADSVVGYGARVVGSVRIGPRSYVAAGAVVTRDVPPEHVVTGINQAVPAAKWPGRRLRGLITHWDRSSPHGPGVVDER